MRLWLIQHFFGWLYTSRPRTDIAGERPLLLLADDDLHHLHQQVHTEWAIRCPSQDYPQGETNMRRREVRTALDRAASMARSRMIGDILKTLSARIELELVFNEQSMTHPSQVLQAYASVMNWLGHMYQCGPTLVGLCETCELAGRGALHLDKEDMCSTCGGPFLATVGLGTLSRDEDAPETFQVHPDVAISGAGT